MIIGYAIVALLFGAIAAVCSVSAGFSFWSIVGTSYAAAGLGWIIVATIENHGIVKQGRNLDWL